MPPKGNAPGIRATRIPLLQDLPTPIKVVLSLAILALGVGYDVALVNLYLTYNLTDGTPGLSVSDLKRAFYGKRDNTKLAVKIDGGSMAQFLTRAGDKEKILSWVQDGAAQEGHEKVVRPILNQNCVRCHNPAGLQRYAPLTSYEQVMAVAQIDRGESPQLWARVAHTHLQSIALVFLVLGGVFAFSSLSDRRKSIILILPFAALLVDFGSRFTARYFPDVVYLMTLSGAAMPLLFAFMAAVSLYEMWWKPRTIE